MKLGYSLVGKWNALPPDQRAEVQEQGRRAALAIMAVKVAAMAQDSGEPPASWDAALERISHPGPAEEMAEAIVAHLQRVPEATAEQIAAVVGAVGKDDSTFKRAMGMARDDGYIHRVGVTFRGVKWDTTEWSDLQLLDTPHVRRIENEIVAFVAGFGIVSLAHISGELGLEDDAPEVRAALERAIAAETVKWYGGGIYGLALEALENFEPKRDLWMETKPAKDDKDLGGAVAELEDAVKGLAEAMKALR